MRRLINVLILGALLAACSKDGESHFLQCGEGLSLIVQNKSYCAYSAALVASHPDVECPAGTQTPLNIDGALFCSAQPDENAESLPASVCSSVGIQCGGGATLMDCASGTRLEENGTVYCTYPETVLQTLGAEWVCPHGAATMIETHMETDIKRAFVCSSKANEHVSELPQAVCDSISSSCDSGHAFPVPTANPFDELHGLWEIVEVDGVKVPEGAERYLCRLLNGSQYGLQSVGGQWAGPSAYFVSEASMTIVYDFDEVEHLSWSIDGQQLLMTLSSCDGTDGCTGKLSRSDAFACPPDVEDIS